MLTVKVTALNLKITFPNSWEEVTLRQFLNLHERVRINDEGEPYYLIKDALECFASDLAGLHQLGAHEEAKIRLALKFLDNRPNFLKLTEPQRIAGVMPPRTLGNCNLKQKWTIDQLIEDWTEEGKAVDFMSLSVPLLSVYLYPKLTGKPFTDEDQIDEVLSIIEALPVTQALPLSAFFLRKLVNSTPSGLATSPSPSPNPPPSGWLMTLYRKWKRTRNTAWFGPLPKTGV